MTIPPTPATQEPFVEETQHHHTELAGRDSNDQLDAIDPEKKSSSDIGTPPAEREEKTIISFGHGDQGNPYNWGKWKKVYVVSACMLLVINSAMGTSVPSGTTPQVSREFNITNDQQVVLPFSIYLVGFVVGPLIAGPASEHWGRKPVMVLTLALYTAFTLGCALAPNYASYIVFRFFAGVGASSPVSVIGGIYADIYDDPKTRGRAMTIFMAGVTWGPVLGPVVSGYVSAALGWRWSYWVSLILAGVTWPIYLFCPETYGPVLLARRARNLRKSTQNDEIYAPMDLEPKTLRNLVVVVLARPFRMMFTESIVACSCLYLSFAYAIFYMFLQSFPIIFISGTPSEPSPYHFSYGEEGLAFLPVGIGAMLACVIYLIWDRQLQNAKDRQAPWAQQEEYRRLPLACLGGPLFVIALFWIGWTARPGIHWIVPTLAALPFGMGYLLLFMALLNYLVDAYEVFAASAASAAACSRSLLAAVLPFAAAPMYDRLGVAWACSLLGFLAMAMCVIPFVFIAYGDRIREASKFCQQLKREKEERMEREREENENWQDEQVNGKGQEHKHREREVEVEVVEPGSLGSDTRSQPAEKMV